MTKEIGAKQVGPNTWRRVVKIVFTRDEIAIITIGILIIGYIVIRSLV